MALAATHIRFALDVKDKYGVKDVQKYVSGAIYPDSRYVAKIDRRLTHPEGFFDWDVNRLDDFKKGWYAHLLYDKIQEEQVKEKFSDIFSLPSPTQGSERWLRFTAIKVLQDMEDLNEFDIAAYLPMLGYVENPCGEDMEKVREYNRIFQRLYEDPSSITINSYDPVWRALGLDDRLTAELKRIIEGYKSDSRTKELVSQIYSDSLFQVNA